MGGGSEADFMIHGIMKYHLFGQELWITTTTVGMTIITIVLLILAFAANRAMKHATEVPGTFQNILELGVEMLEKMTQGILGPSARRFANYIGTIFLFILFCNLSGLFGLRTVTADFGVTFLLGLSPSRSFSTRGSKTMESVTSPVCLNRFRCCSRST